MSKVIVVGGGAAGMFAAIAAAENGHTVILLEKNEKLGKKLYITGKGRCNITNAADMDTLFANVTTNPRFLYSAFYACDNQSVIDFFEKNGLATKVERGGRVFPVSDHSSDVIAALQRALKDRGVEVRLHTRVETLVTETCEEADGAKAWTVKKTCARKSPGLQNSVSAGYAFLTAANFLRTPWWWRPGDFPTRPPVRPETATVLRRSLATRSQRSARHSCLFMQKRSM